MTAMTASPQTGADGVSTSDPCAKEPSNLEQLAGKFHKFVEASPMGIHFYSLTADDSLIFDGANRAADEILGVDNARFVGSTIEQAFPPLAQTEIPTKYRNVAKTGTPWHTDQVVYADDQIAGAYEVHAFQTWPGQMAAIFADITAAKRTESERQRLEQQLIQAQKMEAIGRLAGGIAHDFNNLLMAIRGYADLAEQQYHEGEDPTNDIFAIRKGTEQAAHLIQQLLAFSRKQAIRPQVVDLNKVINELHRMLDRLLGEQVRIDLDLDPSGCVATIDPVQVNQVLLNLALNARDAMAGDGTLNIGTSAVDIDALRCRSHPEASPGLFAVLSVRDTGSGISQKEQPHIFEPFFTTKDFGAGTGLGLAAVYGIVRQNHGFIELDSRIGQGTEFRIYLPTGQPKVEVTQRRATTATAASETGETVLLVEDEAMLRNLLETALAHTGYHVLVAHDGPMAIQLSQSYDGTIDVLLTDVVMPDMNGLQLCERLRANRPELKVIYMSGYTDDVLSQRELCEQDGPLLQKPTSISNLAEKLREVLGA